jgi:hypothetical protein
MGLLLLLLRLRLPLSVVQLGQGEKRQWAARQQRPYHDVLVM